MIPPETRYANSGNVSIAYQVLGHGPLDLVFVNGWILHLEYCWENLAMARFLHRLARFSRLIRFDKRGTGMSDRVSDVPSLEVRMDDVRAVMDATGSTQAAVFGVSEGVPMSVLFAATYPERTTALVLYGGYAKATWSPDYRWRPRQRTVEEFNTWAQTVRQAWGNQHLAASILRGRQRITSWLRLSGAGRKRLVDRGRRV